MDLFGDVIGCGRAAQPRAAIENYVAAHQRQIVREFVDLLAIPNIAADRVNVRRNTDIAFSFE